MGVLLPPAGYITCNSHNFAIHDVEAYPLIKHDFGGLTK
jgi:hypothetical protein